MSSPVSLCVPVLRRYDLLNVLLASLSASEVRVAYVYIVNNGLKPIAGTGNIIVHTPVMPLGVAESWNYFIKNVPGEHLIVNDDISFAPETIGRMVNTPGDLVSPLGVNAFSCFLIRQSCIDKIGLFDESISPGYAYFEDCDYLRRMQLAGLGITRSEGTVTHGHSQTLAAATPAERGDHHRRFMKAQDNYLRKWGGLPDHEVFTQPYGVL